MRLTGIENIPQQKPLLLITNHYSRPGFFVLWGALAVSANLPREPIWMMTKAWTSPGSWWDKPKRFFTSLIFTRLARMYGFITMPPMPPEPQDVTERALSIRRLLQAARSNPHAIIALAPEGRDIPDGFLGQPPVGSGRLMAQLAGCLGGCVAVGIFEESGRLCVSFGKPFHLPTSIDARDDDRISSFIMGKIAAQLPLKMRGVYRRNLYR